MLQKVELNFVRIRCSMNYSNFVKHKKKVDGVLIYVNSEIIFHY